jgi:hypothetical protein
MATGSRRATIDFPQFPTSGGQKMLEWRPRLIVLVFVLALIASGLGFATDDLIRLNWEW